MSRYLFAEQLTLILPNLQCLIKLFQNDKTLDWSKLKELADDNFIFDKIDRLYFRQVENTVRKGEIARYEQFLLFPLCFQNQGLLGKGLKLHRFQLLNWHWIEFRRKKLSAGQRRVQSKIRLHI